MNKALYLIVTLVIAGLVTALAADMWRSNAFIRTHGSEGALRIGRLYNSSRWAEPLPLKKIYSYTATLAPNYEVIIESDQDFAPGQQVFIRHLELGKKSPLESNRTLRPIANSIRLRTEDDGTPLRFDPTLPQERLLEKAMGTPSSPSSTSRAEGSVATNPKQPATAFLVGGANDSVGELIWNNSRAGEWVLLLFVLFLFQAFAINAWTLPWREYKPVEQDKDFVHPSLDQVEPDAQRTPVARIAFKPKPKESEPESASNPESATEGENLLKLPRK